MILFFLFTDMIVFPDVEMDIVSSGHGKSFQLLVTHVAKFHGLIKVFGQTDLSSGGFFNGRYKKLTKLNGIIRSM